MTKDFQIGIQDSELALNPNPSPLGMKYWERVKALLQREVTPHGSLGILCFVVCFCCFFFLKKAGKLDFVVKMTFRNKAVDFQKMLERTLP